MSKHSPLATLTQEEREELQELLEEHIEFQFAMDAEQESIDAERAIERAYYGGGW